MKIFPAKPGVVACLNNKRVDDGSGYGKRQLVENSLSDVLTRTREEGRAVIVESRKRQANGNPLADQWQDETPELQEYYGGVQGEAERLEQDRKARK